MSTKGKYPEDKLSALVKTKGGRFITTLLGTFIGAVTLLLSPWLFTQLLGLTLAIGGVAAALGGIICYLTDWIGEGQ